MPGNVRTGSLRFHKVTGNSKSVKQKGNRINIFLRVLCVYVSKINKSNMLRYYFKMKIKIYTTIYSKDGQKPL